MTNTSFFQNVKKSFSKCCQVMKLDLYVACFFCFSDYFDIYAQFSSLSHCMPQLRLHQTGRLVQLVRTLHSHCRGHWFESSSAHHFSPPGEKCHAEPFLRRWVDFTIINKCPAKLNELDALVPVRHVGHQPVWYYMIKLISKCRANE